MAASSSTERRNGRHAILDLAPLELECLSVLWPIGEGTVRDIREALREIRPRAYTTIMTIMDRMAQKGTVSRRKVGRAWLYAPNVSAGEARERAVRRLVEHFFAGSRAALIAQLAGGVEPDQPEIASGIEREMMPIRPRRTAEPATRRAARRAPDVEEVPPPQARKLDDSLL
jgi:predicted transcriptional regulator